MKAVGYVRVSTGRQAELGSSLEAQEAKIRAMAAVRACEMEEVIVDGGESATDLKRARRPAAVLFDCRRECGRGNCREPGGW